MNPEFIISIIVRARNEIQAVMSKATGSVDKLTASTEKSAAAEKKRADAQASTARQIDDTTKRFEGYRKEIENGTKSGDQAVKQLQSFSREFDRLGNRSAAGSDAAEGLYKLSAASRTMADDIKKASAEIEAADRQRAATAQQTSKTVQAARGTEAKALIKSIEDELAADDRRANQFDKNLDRIDKSERARLLTIQQGRDAYEAAQRAEADASRATASAEEMTSRARMDSQRQLQAEIARTVRSYQNAKSEAEKMAAQAKLSGQAQGLRDLGTPEQDVRRTLSGAYADTRRDDEQITERQKRMQDLIHVQNELRNMEPAPGPSFLQRLLGGDPEKLEQINKMLHDFEGEANRSSFSAVKLAGNLRGMLILGVVAFFQQLVGIGVSLGATLVSLASSAIQAGAALGGALVAGASQAIPVIGLLAAAWGRVGAVFQAVKQAQKARQSAAFDDETLADKQTQAADSIRSAQESLANAQRQGTIAQENLTKARADAVRQIQDLVTAEKEAQLQAESARLAQQASQQTLRRSIASGNVDELAQNSLQARQSNLDVVTSGVAAGRATFDASKAVAGGVEGMDNVVQARRAVADAARGIADAKRQLKEAGDQIGQTAKQMGSADRTLAGLLAQLSPTEKKLYAALERVEKRYKQVFTGPNGVINSILDAFTYGADKAYELLNDPRLVSAARGLSSTIAEQLRRAFDFLSSDNSRNFMVEMANQARINLPIITSLFENVATVFMNIAKAASPALHQFLIFFESLTAQAASTTSSDGGITKLQAFFDKGEKYAESFTKLAVAIAKLFLAIIGDSADQGQNAIDSFTKDVNKATSWIDSHQKQVQKFFSDTRKALGYVLTAVWDLMKALLGLFHPDQVKAFSKAFSQTLLPVLQNVLTVTGMITKLFLDLAGTKVGGAILQLVLTTLLLRSALSPILSVLSKFVIFFGRIFNSAGLVEAGLAGLRVATGPLGIALSAIASTFLILSGNVHSFGDAIKDLIPIIGALVIALYARGGLSSALGALGNGLSKIPGLGRLASRGGTVAEIEGAAEGGGVVASIKGAGRSVIKKGGGAVTVAEDAARTGSAVGGIAGGAFMTAVKKAGWLGLGFSAASGFLSGLRQHSVAGGIQDFMHDITFGLIKSSAELAKEAVKGVGDTLTKTVGKSTRQINAMLNPYSTRQVPSIRHSTTGLGVSATGVPSLDRSGAGGTTQSPGTATGPTVFADWFARLTKAQQTFVLNFRQYDQQLQQYIQGHNTFGPFFDNFYDGLKNFAKTAPPQFQTAIQKLLDNASDAKQKFDRIWAHQQLPSDIASEFGLALEAQGASVDKVVVRLIDKLKPLGPQAKKKAEDAAVQMARGLEEQGKLPAGSAKKIRDDIDTAFEQMRKKATKSAAKTAGDVATVLNAMVSITVSQLNGMITSTNSILKALGFGHITLPSSLSGSDVSKGAKGAGQWAGFFNGLLSGSAGGGFIGKMGERGADVVPKLLGRGEAVLGWAHQRLVEPAMRAMYGFGLGGMFDRVKGKHGEEAVGGKASGGFVAEPGTNFSYGQEPLIVSALRKLGQILKTTIYGISGFRTPQHSVAVGGFADDPHTMGEAADVGVGAPTLASAARLTAAILKRVGLYRPFYPADPHEINHVQLLASAAKTLKGAAAQSIGTMAQIAQHLTAPAVPGSGPLHDIVKGVIDRSYAAANKRIDQADGGAGASGAIPSFHGPWTQVMSRIAKAKNWNLGDWKQLVKGESGGQVSIVNASSGAFGLGQFLGATAKAYAKFGALSNSGVDQIRAMAQYISDRYGSPSKALHDWLSRSPHWYNTGGPVAGSGPVGAVLHGGEHVWTAKEVAAAGGHAAMRFMRRLLGGGGQARGNEYAAGGAAKAYVEPILHSTNTSGLTQQLEAALGVIQRLGSSIINKKFTDALSHSFQAVLGDGGLLDAMNDAISRLTDKLATNLTLATYKFNKSGQLIKSDPVKMADLAVANLRQIYSGLIKEQGSINDELANVAKRLKSKSLTSGERDYLTGVQRNLQARLATVRDNIAQNLSDTYQAVEDEIQTQVDKASTAAGLKTGVVGIMQRLRTLGGDTLWNSAGGPSNSALAGAAASALNQQADALQKAMDVANKAGHTDTAQQLAGQIADLRTQALEAVEQGLSADADAISAAGSRRSSQLDLQDRISQVIENSGNSALAFQQRGSTLQARGTNIQNQIAGLSVMQQQAAAQGFGALSNQLSDQIAELNTELAENTDAIAANTASARQAALDAITSQGGFISGVFGGLQGIVTALGTLTGTLNTPEQISLIKSQGASLQNTGGQLLGQLASNFGINLQGQSPAEIVASLSGLNYQGIEAGMRPDEKAVFEALINSIIENTSSQIQNSTALQQATNALEISTPLTTAFQIFRQSILTGSGGVLPQYQIPGLYADQSSVSSPSASISQAVGPGAGGGTDAGGDTWNLNIEHPVPVFDPMLAMRELEFARTQIESN